VGLRGCSVMATVNALLVLASATPHHHSHLPAHPPPHQLLLLLLLLMVVVVVRPGVCWHVVQPAPTITTITVTIIVISRTASAHIDQHHRSDLPGLAPPASPVNTTSIQTSTIKLSLLDPLD